MAAKAGEVESLKAFKDFGSEALLALTERDANPEKEGGGWFPIQYAANAGKRDAIRFLTFEVGWGPVKVDDVLKVADKRFKKEIEGYSKLEGEDFERHRERYLSDLVKKSGNEL